MWSQILYWIGRCGNRNKIVISRVSILVSGLVASQVTLSFCKLETGLRSWGGKSLKWQKHPALCDCFYGWMLLKPMSLSGGGPMMRVLGGDQCLTVFKRWSWAVCYSPHWSLSIFTEASVSHTVLYMELWHMLLGCGCHWAELVKLTKVLWRLWA